MTEADIRRLSSDELFKQRSIALPGSDARIPLDAEVERRDFLARQSAGKTSERVAWLTAMIVLVGMAEVLAAIWSPRNDIGRYTEIRNPTPLCGESASFACGIAILDTKTGTVYLRQNGGWAEEHPQTSKATGRSLDVR